MIGSAVTVGETICLIQSACQRGNLPSPVPWLLSNAGILGSQTRYRAKIPKEKTSMIARTEHKLPAIADGESSTQFKRRTCYHYPQRPLLSRSPTLTGDLSLVLGRRQPGLPCHIQGGTHKPCRDRPLFQTRCRRTMQGRAAGELTPLRSCPGTCCRHCQVGSWACLACGM